MMAKLRVRELNKWAIMMIVMLLALGSSVVAAESPNIFEQADVEEVFVLVAIDNVSNAAVVYAIFPANWNALDEAVQFAALPVPGAFTESATRTFTSTLNTAALRHGASTEVAASVAGIKPVVATLDDATWKTVSLFA